MLVDGTLRALTLSDKDKILDRVAEKEDRGMRSQFVSQFYKWGRLYPNFINEGGVCPMDIPLPHL